MCGGGVEMEFECKEWGVLGGRSVNRRMEYY